MNALHVDIYRTLAYFSYFSYPLTAFEVWKYMYEPSSPWTWPQIQDGLASFPQHQGFYGLEMPGTLTLVEQIELRHDRYLDAIRKYRRLKLFVRYLRLLPWVRGVAICNTLAFHHTKPESDIDLFVITSVGRVWTVRFLAVFPLIALRLRPREARRDPIDISFLISEAALDLEPLRLAPTDPYFAYWLATLRPVIDRGGIFKALLQANNWVATSLPNIQIASDITTENFAQRILSWISPSEGWFEKIQRAKFPDEIIEQANRSSQVVINAAVLKFHKNDRRQEIREYLEDKMKLCTIG